MLGARTSDLALPCLGLPCYAAQRSAPFRPPTGGRHERIRRASARQTQSGSRGGHTFARGSTVPEHRRSTHRAPGPRHWLAHRGERLFYPEWTPAVLGFARTSSSVRGPSPGRGLPSPSVGIWRARTGPAAGPGGLAPLKAGRPGTRRGTMKTKTRDQDRDEVGWSLMLRRQTDGSVQGQPHTSDAESYELICRVCGDDSRLDLPRRLPRLSAAARALPHC